VAWLRQEENQYLSVPREIARQMPDDVLTLIGWSQPSSSLGYWDSGRHPLSFLRQGGEVGEHPQQAPLIDWAQPLSEQPEPIGATGGGAWDEAGGIGGAGYLHGQGHGSLGWSQQQGGQGAGRSKL
jgi:hypothetical protein